MEQIEEQLTIDKNPKTARFSEAPWFSPKIDIFVGGSGGISSWVALFLARQEANLYIFDFDTIEESNMAGQCFRVDQIGKTKTAAIKENIKAFCGHEQVEEMGKYMPASMTNKYVLCGFDNMAARKTMFENWLEVNKDEKDAIFIDGRALAEVGQIYFVTPDRAEEYRATLFEDEEAPLENCSYKSTTFCGAIIAGLMVSGFNNFIANIKAGRIRRDVPFSVIYELPIFNFTIK